MNLYLMRHGIAVERSEPGIKNDTERFLTKEGKTKVRAVAEALLRLDFEFDLILSSPLVRARETAEIMTDVFGLKKKLQFAETLAAGSDPKFFVQEIRDKHSSVSNLLAVGHEPFLSNLASVLISSKPFSDITMKKAGLCKIALSGPIQFNACGTLQILLPPKVLLGRAG